MINKKRQHTLPVFSQRLAATLMLSGFNLLDMAPSKTNPDKNVYYFRNSDEIRVEIEKYIKSKKVNEGEN